MIVFGYCPDCETVTILYDEDLRKVEPGEHRECSLAGNPLLEARIECVHCRQQTAEVDFQGIATLKDIPRLLGEISAQAASVVNESAFFLFDLERNIKANRPVDEDHEKKLLRLTKAQRKWNSLESAINDFKIAPRQPVTFPRP